MAQYDNKFSQTARIKVIGIGGGGCNAVNRMVQESVQGVEFIIANTDAQVLAASPVSNKIILGEQVSKGLGAGANPEIGRQAAIESEPSIKDHLKDSDLIFIAAGMGGGTGTGAAPEIARIAQETGALVVAIVTKPFRFEGRMRNSYAIQGVAELKKHVDSLIVISNDRLLEIIGNIPIQDSFKEADNVLKQGVQTITDLIAVPALVNLDFADVRTVLKGRGNALFGIGIGSGPDKAIEAANKAITSSLLETSIRGAKSAIVNVTGGLNMSLNDAHDAVDIIEQAAGDELNVIFGAAVNEHLNDELIVTVIATGFDDAVVDDDYQPEQSIQYEEPNNTEPEYSYSSRRMQPQQPSRYDNQNDNNEMKVVKPTANVQEQQDDDDDGDFPTFLRKTW
ncbi:cell division protein FtsZ [Spiroplasma endosymbiont of Labia minor]|uniref:cell division protein FtsZ n=1 Tax=Spiroplasma endosymbiont of Labia minor TaxID=3066305 RepID=UPI0030CCAC80